MTRKELLNEILNKTTYLTSAIASEDLDIINNLLDERKLLMDEVDANPEPSSNVHKDILKEIAKIDQENKQLMRKLEIKITNEGNKLMLQKNAMKKSTRATKRYIQGNEVLESKFNKTR